MDGKSVAKVKWFNDAKGFGFAQLPDGRDVFIHYSKIHGTGFRTLPDGAEVQFDLIETAKGLQAENVELI